MLIDSQGLYNQNSTLIQIEISSSQIIPWSLGTTLEFHQKITNNKTHHYK